MVAISPWVFPGFAGLGQLSQTSDRLYSCGFADRQCRPSSATGAGGFEVIIANCKLQNCKLQIANCKLQIATFWTRFFFWQPLLLPLCVRRRPERCTYLVPRLREARRRRRGLPRIGSSRRQAPRRAAGGNGEPGAPP